ncbi:MAG: 50S ribosomal protein L15e [Candidatus Woesearchaeota archaeon]
MLYKYIRESFRNPNEELTRERLIKWRREPSIVRLERPTRLDRARSLGYRAKQGIIIVRVKIKRGGRKRQLQKAGRRSKTSRRMKIVSKNYQWVAEERVARKYVNCEVLNSYYVLEDGRYYWFEVILVDRDSPVIKADKDLRWISEDKGRAFRGKTSAGRRSRGLHGKGKGYEKIRPSLRAHNRKSS